MNSAEKKQEKQSFRHSLAAQLQQLRVYKASGIDDRIRLLQKLRAAHRDEICRPGAGSDKMNHSLTPIKSKNDVSSRKRTRQTGRRDCA